ncbi:F-box only protein 7-like [Amyelois transitella]|uniref:F-box only protein 7-like n=1 Tax=Amyelois transitella TaxID=680683 RepID=UPI00298F7BD5|nr:F-box only protein 7-like [Amyelois transitella]
MNFNLEDSTTNKLPYLLEEILKNILSDTRSANAIQKEILLILIIILMIENGFLPINEESQIIEPLESIDMEQMAKWKTHSGIYEVKFIMAGFQSGHVKLIMSPLGSTVLINVLLHEINSETYSVCLPVSRYVVSPQASTIPMIFRDLKHLSISFKNKITTPIKSSILTYHGYPSASLIGLPEELFFKIVIELTIFDIINISKTCSRLNYLICNERLWHDLYKRDFNSNISAAENWRSKYKEAFTAREDEKLRQTRRGTGTMHDYMDYSDYVSYIDNPMWHII